MTDVQYPIAEHFLSPQGEGAWAGTLMHFIRFAGCSVGKPFTSADRRVWYKHNSNGVLHIYQEKCCSAIGEDFVCDTDFRMKQKMSIADILDAVGNTQRVCLTGGEPLMHDIDPLITALHDRWRDVHIETSGTIPFSRRNHTWVAVSPKTGCLDVCLHRCDEIKVLVGENFDEQAFCTKFASWITHDKVWVQPVNHEFDVNRDNLDRCLSLQKRYPKLRISTQLHKIWGVR